VSYCARTGYVTIDRHSFSANLHHDALKSAHCVTCKQQVHATELDPNLNPIPNPNMFGPYFQNPVNFSLADP